MFKTGVLDERLTIVAKGSSAVGENRPTLQPDLGEVLADELS